MHRSAQTANSGELRTAVHGTTAIPLITGSHTPLSPSLSLFALISATNH